MSKTVADYPNFHHYYTKIEVAGNELYDLLSDSYKTIGELYVTGQWRGIRYAKLAKAFNDIAPKLDDIVNDIAYTIPQGLRNAADQYSNADTSDNNYGTSSEARKIIELEVNEVEKIEFEESFVDAAKVKVSNNFEEAKQKITTAKQVLESMNSDEVWCGDAYDKTIERVSGYETSVHSYLDSLISDFEQAIVESIADVQTANANSIIE